MPKDTVLRTKRLMEYLNFTIAYAARGAKLLGTA